MGDSWSPDSINNSEDLAIALLPFLLPGIDGKRCFGSADFIKNVQAQEKKSAVLALMDKPELMLAEPAEPHAGTDTKMAAAHRASRLDQHRHPGWTAIQCPISMEMPDLELSAP